jgi:hypothetical protein
MKKDSCIICLGDSGTISSNNTHLGCKCNVPVHTNCWMQYVKTKRGTLECPMCHVITLANPIIGASITGLDKELQQHIYSHSDFLREERQRDQCVGRSLACCMVSCVLTIAATVVLG